MLTQQQQKDLAYVETRKVALVNKPGSLTKKDEARLGLLNSQAASIRAGLTLADLSDPQEQIRGWKRVLETGQVGHAEAVEIERRDMTEGSPITRIGTYTGLGFFVPTDFFPSVFASLKAHDALFDDAACTLIKSTNGRPLPIPLMSDTENVASVVAEAGNQISVDIDSTDHAVLGAYSYSTPRFVTSLEAFDDLEGGLSVLNLFRKFSADRIAWGVGRDLVTGNGVGKTLGLIPSLEAAGATIITASGSAANDGGTSTGANSLGTDDFAAAFQTIDEAYLASPRAAWFLNRHTLGQLEQIKDKMGAPVKLVDYSTGVARIYGIRVRICPSMDNIGASNVPVVLGDGSFWATRLVQDDLTGIRVYTNAPGLIEQGNVGLRTYVRADGALLWKDASSPSPFVLVRNHS
jgi:HK97 family phage major capsid protein